MSIPIKTSQIKYSINRGRIDELFDIFTIQTTNRYFKSGSYIIDAPVLDNNVCAVRFERGNKFSVLMKKDTDNKRRLLKAIEDTPESTTITVTPVKSYTIEDHVLLQLLLNSLANADHPLLRFTNLTGHFYCFHPEWIRKKRDENIIWQVPCIEISFHEDKSLHFDVRTFTSEKLRSKITFRKKRFEDYPKYVLSVNNTLRRKLKDDKDTAFIQRQIDNERNGKIKFLSIGSLETFQKSKMGIVHEVLTQFNKIFMGLAKVSFNEICNYSAVDYDICHKNENNTFIKNELNSMPIRIVDGICDEYSKEFCIQLQMLLNDRYGVLAKIGKRVVSGNLNILLIHNAAYYTDGADPYNKKYPDIAVQHITLEDYDCSNKSMLSSIVHEILIKKDLKDGIINIFDWKKMLFTEDVSFGTSVNTDSGERYFFMNVHPDGTFDFKEQENTFFEQAEYQECLDVFEQSRINNVNVLGVVKDSHGNINTIIDTEWVTIPEIDAIYAELSSGNTSIRNKDIKAKLFNSVIDVRYYSDKGAVYYFVGIKGLGMDREINYAVNIRKIVPFGNSQYMFERLLPLMSVTFIKNNQLTIVPFPFKYLREYIRSKDIDI